MKIAVAGDHFAAELISKITLLLADKGLTVENLGSTAKDEEKDLKEIILAVTKKVQNQEVNFGILACGTGVGVEIGANRLKGIRASLCRDAEQAKNARVYDDTNVLCLGSWYDDDLEQILEAWLDSQFGGDTDSKKLIQDFDELS